MRNIQKPLRIETTQSFITQTHSNTAKFAVCEVRERIFLCISHKGPFRTRMLLVQVRTWIVLFQKKFEESYFGSGSTTLARSCRHNFVSALAVFHTTSTPSQQLPSTQTSSHDREYTWFMAVLFFQMHWLRTLQENRWSAPASVRRAERKQSVNNSNFPTE